MNASSIGITVLLKSSGLSHRLARWLHAGEPDPVGDAEMSCWVMHDSHVFARTSGQNRCNCPLGSSHRQVFPSGKPGVSTIKNALVHSFWFGFFLAP